MDWITVKVQLRSEIKSKRGSYNIWSNLYIKIEKKNKSVFIIRNIENIARKQRLFGSLNSLPYSIFSLEIKVFTLLRRNFSLSFFPLFFRTAGQDALSRRPVKVGTIFRRASRLTGEGGGSRAYIRGEPATIKFKIYDDTFAASKVALNFRYA